MEKKTPTLKIANAWATCSNPLAGLTRPAIEQLLETVRHGNDSRLQLAFEQMERITPIYGVVIQRRLAGVLNRNWQVDPINNSERAEEQAEAVWDMFREADTLNMDGFTDAIRHLCLATFRGRSAVKPFIDDEGRLYFKRLNNWNVLEYNGNLYWNPKADYSLHPDQDADIGPDKLVPLPSHEVAWIKEERPVDVAGIQVYLRQLVGEEQWARAVEKYGIAQVIITPPEGTPDTALESWKQKAIRIFEGGSGVLPQGAEIQALTDARGQDPFSKFVEHQQEVIVLLACGSTLGTLAGPTGLGTGLAESQNETFQSLVNLDCKRIANAISNVVVRKCVKHLFPGEPVLCRFNFTERNNTTPMQYLEYALKAHMMGLDVNVARLKELTGLDFLSKEQTMLEGGEVWSPSNGNDVERTEKPADK